MTLLTFFVENAIFSSTIHIYMHLDDISGAKYALYFHNLLSENGDNRVRVRVRV